MDVREGARMMMRALRWGASVKVGASVVVVRGGPQVSWWWRECRGGSASVEVGRKSPCVIRWEPRMMRRGPWVMTRGPSVLFSPRSPRVITRARRF